LVCSIRGHVLPAAEVAELRPEDAGLGLDLLDGRRLARCLRCDDFCSVARPAHSSDEHLPPLDQLIIPRRGQALRQALITRIIAGVKLLHSLAFAMIALGFFLLYLNLHGLQHGADDLVNAISDTGAPEQATVRRLAEDISGLHAATLVLLAVGALVYAVVEGVEGLGLWRERRWAEYLTVVTTAAFLPLEIHELLARFTVIRTGAFILNLAILIYLALAKRLFGLRGGTPALHQPSINPLVVFAPPSQKAQTIGRAEQTSDPPQ
jgi:uncharacterized membrane protein (DUF2068 family)